MYLINRSHESEEGGVATLENATETVLELTATEPTEGTQAGEAIQDLAPEEEDDFSFLEEGGTASSTSQAPTAPTIAETVPKIQYDKVVGELEALKADFTKLQSQFETNPLVQAAVEYQQGLEAGVDLNPAAFMESYFGVDASRLDVDSLIKLQIREEAAAIGHTLTDETFELTFESRKMKFEDMDDLQKAAFVKNLRDIRTQAAREKQEKLINERKADIEKGQKFWIDAYENGVKPLLDKIASEGKKEFGLLKGEVTKDEAVRIATAIANNFYRFNADGKLNYQHAVEVAQFSADMPAYIKRIEKKAIDRHEVKRLRDMGASKGAGLSSATTLLDKTKGVISDKPLTNLLDGAEVVQ